MAKSDPDSPGALLRIALRGTGDEGERIDAAERLRDLLWAEERRIALAMRERGQKWEDVAEVFGITRQAAHKRFSKAGS